MAWVESSSGAFRARHDSADARDARRVLESLQLTRERLSDLFPRSPQDVTVILHGGVAALSLTNPVLPMKWLLTAPAARRYVGGWAGRREIHMLAPKVLRARASNVPGSREMLALTAAALYARRVIQENNHELRHVMSAIRIQRELHWAWLLDGAARWFSGQTGHARPAIARRLREGGTPRFPPGPRDAPLLGGTVIDLLVSEHGERVAARLASRLHPQGHRAAITQAFPGRPFVHTEGAWRSHLARLAGAA